MSRISRILVPVDFSEDSRSALDYAIFLAGRFSAAIEVVHVWEPPLYGPDDLTLPGAPPQPTLEQYVRQRVAEEMTPLIASATEGITGPKPKIEGRFVVGHPVDNIVELARAEACDLIVMGTHGRRGVSRLVIGSVAERVMRSAPCPVLTVRGTNTQHAGPSS